MSSPLLDYLTSEEPLFRPTRLPSLYSDLSVQKTSNPEGYAANVTAWTAALARASAAGLLPPEHNLNLLVLNTSTSLVDALASRTYGRPSGLGCVLDECVRQGKFVDLKEFVVKEESIYHKSWTQWIPTPWTVVKWGARQAGLGGLMGGSWETTGGGLRAGKLVLVPVLEEFWRKLQPILDGQGQALTDRVMSRAAFSKEVTKLVLAHHGEEENKTGATSISEQDLQVLLRYLSRDKQILSYDQTTIKLKASTSASPEPITQEDRTIATLKSLIQDLQERTVSISMHISSLQAQAAAAVKASNKPSALSALKRKKLAEKTLQSRLDTLSQLEEVYTKIESAVSQVEIVQAMESSATTLKLLNKNIGGVDRVDRVLEDLREEVSKVDEVSGVLSEPGAVDQKALLYEEDVDDELEMMEREEREKAERLEEEKTRLRLRETDAFEQKCKETERWTQQERDRPAQEKNEDWVDVLSTSTERLQNLDLNRSSREKEAVMTDQPGDESQPQKDQRPKEPLAEGTS